MYIYTLCVFVYTYIYRHVYVYIQYIVLKVTATLKRRDIWKAGPRQPSDKSQGAVVLDDSLTLCTELSQAPAAKSKVLWRKWGSTLHIIAHKYSQRRWRPQSLSIWCTEQEKGHPQITLQISSHCRGCEVGTVLAPSVLWYIWLAN